MPDSLSPSRLEPMRPRDPHEPGRTASTLELFFDLVFVIAVSRASGELHHAISEGHVSQGLEMYAICFFGIWWAWMNFTWFATSFDTDDWLYRVVTFVQMGGVLVFAAGIGPAFEHDLRLVVYGYVVMRVAMVAQWLRAAHATHRQARTAALIYAIGIFVVQALWLLSLLLHGPIATISFVVLIAAEITVPVIAERIGSTPWHPHHITERYGLFTLILLGESLLGSANAIIEAIHEHDALAPLLSISSLTLVMTAALWWIYFWPPHHRAISTFASSLRYGYVHYFVFAAAGALSAGIELQIDVSTHHTELGEVPAAFAITVPVAVFILGIWWIALRCNAGRVVNVVVPVGALLILIAPVLPLPIGSTAVVLVVIVAVLVRYPPVTRDASGEETAGETTQPRG